MKMRLLVTGKPGSGKTTLCEKIAGTLQTRGIGVGGMISKEIREGGVRVGFKIIDISTGREASLAHIRGEGLRIGKYHVNIKGIEDVGVFAIDKAIEKRMILLIDEIGPMELFSRKFIEAVERAFESDLSVLATIHNRSSHPLVERLKHSHENELYDMTIENREALLNEFTGRFI